MKTTRNLILKKGFAKINGERIPITDNKLISENLGKHGLHGMDDLIDCIYNVGPAFKQVYYHLCCSVYTPLDFQSWIIW